MYFNRWRKVYQPILIAFRFPILILREFSLPSIIHLVVYNVQDQHICRNDYIYFERLVISCLGFGLLVSTRIDGCNHLKFPSESYIRGFFVLDLKIGIFISQIISQCVQCRWRISHLNVKTMLNIQLSFPIICHHPIFQEMLMSLEAFVALLLLMWLNETSCQDVITTSRITMSRTDIQITVP